MEMWNYRHNINKLTHIIIGIHEVGIHDKGQYFDYYKSKKCFEAWKVLSYVFLLWCLAGNRKMWHWNIQKKHCQVDLHRPWKCLITVNGLVNTKKFKNKIQSPQRGKKIVFSTTLIKHFLRLSQENHIDNFESCWRLL